MTIKELVKVKRSKRARRVALRLDPKEGVMNLVVPPNMRLDNALRFAQLHEEWVKEILESLPPVKPFEDGTILPILGVKRRISVDYDPDYKRTDITLMKTVLHVKTNQEDPSKRIRRFLKTLAKEELTKMTHKKAAVLKKHVSAVTIRDPKSRWGSCSEEGRISYSWRLIFAPMHAMDYVVAHEVAHLIYMDHSENFWRVCRKLSHNYSEGQNWMRHNGNILLRYGE